MCGHSSNSLGTLPDHGQRTHGSCALYNLKPQSTMPQRDIDINASLVKPAPQRAPCSRKATPHIKSTAPLPHLGRRQLGVQASTAARARVKTKGEHVSVGGSSLCDVSNFCSGGRNTHVSPSRSPHHEPLVHTSHCPQGCGYVITHTSIRTAGAGCAHNRACGDAMTVLTGWLPLD